MKSEIIVTEDNSKTLLIPELNETYHSTKGAITEALHVFIKEGLIHSQKQNLNIFEMGFGTGLNAILTYNYAIKNGLTIEYHCIEAYPLEFEKVNSMDYLKELELSSFIDVYKSMHAAENGNQIQLSENFRFIKHISKIEQIDLTKTDFDLIYYDAFGPKVQPNLWNEEIMQKMYDTLNNDGLLVTYCAQGAFKRTLNKIGFIVESIPGPPGKREMTRARKRF